MAQQPNVFTTIAKKRVDLIYEYSQYNPLDTTVIVDIERNN